MTRTLIIGFAIIFSPLLGQGQIPCEIDTIYRSDTLEIYSVVEVAPSPEGGLETYYKWIEKNKTIMNKKKTGEESKKVFIGFTVNEFGELSDFKVVRGLSSQYDNEAMRLIKDNPTKWIPGKCGSTNVRTQMTMVVKF
jgi:protein TonB